MGDLSLLEAWSGAVLRPSAVRASGTEKYRALPNGRSTERHALSLSSRVFSYKGCIFPYTGTRAALARAIKPPIIHLGLFAVGIKDGSQSSARRLWAGTRLRADARENKRGKTRARLSSFLTALHRAAKLCFSQAVIQWRFVWLSVPFAGSCLNAGMIYFKKYISGIHHPSSLSDLFFSTYRVLYLKQIFNR